MADETTGNRTTDRWSLGGGGGTYGTLATESVLAHSVSMICAKYRTTVTDPRVSERASYEAHNVIKASEVNDPFAFPPETTYTVGTGRILAEATRQLDISDRNFGSYPSYVFTDAGVYELAGATADAVHARMSSPTFMEAPISGVICQTPYGIAYASRSGLMLLTSTYVAGNLSERIWARRREPHFDFVPLPDCYGLTDFDFRGFLMEPSRMTYDPHTEELRVASDRFPSVLLVFSFGAKEWYFMEQSLGGGNIVEGSNMYPRVRSYGVRADGSVAVQRWDEGHALQSLPVLLVSRPFTFGTTYIKNVIRLWTRGWLESVKEGRWGIGWSESGDAFHDVNHRRTAVESLHPFHTTEKPQRHFRDLDSGLLPKNKARYFALALRAMLGIRTHIEAVEIEHNYTYVQNDKLR